MKNYFEYTPPEIYELQGLLRHVSEEKLVLDLESFSSKSKKYTKFLYMIYKEWFPSSKSYSDIHISECLFQSDLETPTWVNMNLISLIKSVKRVQEKVIYCLKNNQPVREGEILLLGEMIIDSIEFLNLGYECITGISTGNGTHRRRNIMSYEIFNASKSLLRKEAYLSDIITFPSAVFFIRQAIEIRLKNAFGIVSIIDENGKLMKITGENFLALVDENSSDLVFPIKKSIVKKIHSWTNYYIHGAIINYTWQIEWAHYMLQPLFVPGEVEGVGWNISGSIKMKRNYYNSVEQKITKFFNCENGIKVIRMRHPEAIIIED
ncbi:hypothetical protein [Paenibacillus oryzisoli]|uniref:Uncharacterized protein n=1 Tax=Paenibacillus oryzisoli TaxID=1850517 RepID=A0A197ZY30_9BACL|nr:hypothetical protein [Paenibacillus oryzisoli]OAS13732.1 hypothetical protein A8708_25155 [Paenibacillus oryzisoli]